MKSDIFEVLDKTGRKIRLTQRQYSHMMKRHSYMEKYLEEIKETLKVPDKLLTSSLGKGYYYRNYNYLKKPNRFVLVVVKYLNGEGFALTAYLVEKIK